MKKLGIENLCSKENQLSQKQDMYVSDIGQGDHRKNVLPANKDVHKKSKYPPDECFDPQKPSSSHGWIFDDETQKEKWNSEVRANFKVPVKPSVANGIRYQLQYKQAMAEALQEMEDEEKKRNEREIEPYRTEYNKMGGNIKFKSMWDDKEYLSKLASKYPLYRTPVMTLYRHLYLTYRKETGGTGAAAIPGMTRPADSDNLWNKYCAYTTPIDQLLQEPPGGL